MKTITFNNINYPLYESEGDASQFAIPFAKHFCSGTGYDIGCSKIEWSFPGSIPIDINLPDEYDALNLPHPDVDYIYSSHCLEHVDNWVIVMDYWYKSLKPGGVLFLYLPHYSQEYWRPWNNYKHKHIFTPTIIVDYMKNRGYHEIFHSERDLNDSFMVVGEK